MSASNPQPGDSNVALLRCIIDELQAIGVTLQQIYIVLGTNTKPPKPKDE